MILNRQIFGWLQDHWFEGDADRRRLKRSSRHEEQGPAGNFGYESGMRLGWRGGCRADQL
jgi:hypothetical protein